MEGKKVAIVVVLIVAIVAAFVIMAQRMELVSGGPRPPDRVLNQQLPLIDMNKPYTLVTKTLREWEKLGHDDAGHYRNPDTKEFTMATPMSCMNCQKQIPPPPYPAGMQAMDPPVRDAEKMKADQAYKCPLCGQSPFPPEMLNRELPTAPPPK